MPRHRNQGNDQGAAPQRNELFSGIEKHVSMESFINIDRMFFGPGKRESKNPKKSGSAKIEVMYSLDGRPSFFNEIYENEMSLSNK